MNELKSALLLADATELRYMHLGLASLAAITDVLPEDLLNTLKISLTMIQPILEDSESMEYSGDIPILLVSSSWADVMTELLEDLHAKFGTDESWNRSLTFALEAWRLAKEGKIHRFSEWL